MSWLYSRALVEAYSGDISSDGAPSAQSSKTPTPLAYCAPDKMTAFWRLSRFGTTFVPLTESHGEAVLTSFLAAFPAKTSAPPAKEPESTENEADSGEKWLASFAKFDRASCSWKTRQCSLVAGSELYSETWPSSGTMRDGACWELPTLERHTDANEFGSWLPTPTANHGGTQNNGKRKDGSTFKTAGAPSLATMASRNMWPTPTAGDARGSGSRNTASSKAHAGVSLTDAVRGDGGTGRSTRNMWPTPTAHNAKEGAFLAEYGRNTPTLACHAGGPLNPTWVEWLMGWPLGWTALEPLVTAKYLRWLRSHGDY